MKALLLSISLLLLVSNPVYALIETENVDRDEFQYEVGYQFATGDLQASQSAVEIPVIVDLGHNFDLVVPRKGSLVGMSVAGNAACATGAATFDVTIAGTVTGIQTVIEPTAGSSAQTATGVGGAAGPQYAYIRKVREDSPVARGFRHTYDRNSFHDADHVYGKATALSAGNRIGVKVTTSSDFAPTSSDYVVVIYALH